MSSLNDLFYRPGGGGGGGNGFGPVPGGMVGPASGAAVIGPSALTTSEQRALNRGGRSMSPLTLGGGRGGGALATSDGNGCGGAVSVVVSAGAASQPQQQAPQRRGSFQSNASLEFGLPQGGDEVCELGVGFGVDFGLLCCACVRAAGICVCFVWGRAWRWAALPCKRGAKYRGEE